MVEMNPSMAQQIAQAAMNFQTQQTGHSPESVAVVLNGDTLVVTLHGALTKVEKTLAQSAEGASKVQEFHRQLFNAASEPLRQVIKKITGADVRESTSEIETAAGTVIQAFASGTMVQVFLLAKKVPPSNWTEDRSGNPPAV